MNSCKYTDFGLCVKTELLKQGKTQTWLQNAVTERTGLYIDSGYMYKILTGKRSPDKVISAIREVLHLDPKHTSVSAR